MSGEAYCHVHSGLGSKAVDDSAVAETRADGAEMVVDGQVAVSDILADYPKSWLISSMQADGSPGGDTHLATAVLLDCIRAKPTDWFERHDVFIACDDDDLLFNTCQLTVNVGEIKREKCLVKLVDPVRAALEDGLCGTWDDDDVEVTVVDNRLAMTPRVGELDPDRIEIDYVKLLGNFCSALAFLVDEGRGEDGFDAGPASAIAARTEAWHTVEALLAVMVGMTRSGVIAIDKLEDSDAVKRITRFVGAVIVMCGDWQKLSRAEVAGMLDDAEVLRPDVDMSMFRDALEDWPY
jgi:hypothetical protein